MLTRRLLTMAIRWCIVILFGVDWVVWTKKFVLMVDLSAKESIHEGGSKSWRRLERRCTPWFGLGLLRCVFRGVGLPVKDQWHWWRLSPRWRFRPVVLVQGAVRWTTEDGYVDRRSLVGNGWLKLELRDGDGEPGGVLLCSGAGVVWRGPQSRLWCSWHVLFFLLLW